MTVKAVWHLDRALKAARVVDHRVVHYRPQPSSSRTPAPANSMRVLIGNDDPLYLAGICEALRITGAEVVACVPAVQDVARKTRAHSPDLVVFDLDMARLLSPENQIKELRGLRSLEPCPAMLILSRLPDAEVALSVLGNQPAGYGFLVKRNIENLADFTGPAWRVVCGGTSIDPLVRSRLANRAAGPVPDLTERERQVMSLIAEGRSNMFIAGKLVVTVPAVERHVTNIFLKLNLPPNTSDHRRVLAVLQYLEGSTASEDYDEVSALAVVTPSTCGASQP
jgi:DNA-binding NarL/FixJ family response regulator